MASLLDLYRNVFGGEADQGAPVAVQNRQGGFDPYRPAPPPDALELLKSVTGYTDLQQAGQAYQRGEYLPALGQGAWGGLQAASTAFPVLKAGGAALRAGAPLAREAAGAIPGLLADETGAIRAYHGSPHSFDRFDISKIGTGEGAQAYGHGLYFAEREPVARQYRDQLSQKTIDDLPLEEVIKRGSGDTLAMRAPTNESIIADYIQSYGDIPSARFMLDRKNRLDLVEMLDEMEKSGRIKAGGHMYEVDIHADPKALLDWDKPLSAQPQAIRDFMAGNRIPEVLTEYQHSWPGRGDMPVTGEEAYKQLSRRLRPTTLSEIASSGGEGATTLVPQALRETGIPGIRYLDQGSRGAGAGTSNYAIFDPSIIEILRKYGILPPAVATGGLLATQGEPPT